MRQEFAHSVGSLVQVSGRRMYGVAVAGAGSVAHCLLFAAPTRVCVSCAYEDVAYQELCTEPTTALGSVHTATALNPKDL